MPSIIAWCKELAGRNGGGAAGLASVEERADLSVEESHLARVLEYRNNGFYLGSRDVVINLHRAADGAVPAVGGRNTETALLAEDDGVAGGVKVHCPGDTEVKNYTAFETDERCGEIVDREALGVILGLIIG